MPMRPGVKSIFVVAPGKPSNSGRSATRRHIGMGVEQGRGEIAPGELGQIFLRRACQPRLFCRGGFHCVRDAARRNLAEAQIGRQARRGAMLKDVPLVRVVFQPLRDENFERSERACSPGFRRG